MDDLDDILGPVAVAAPSPTTVLRRPTPREPVVQTPVFAKTDANGAAVVTDTRPVQAKLTFMSGVTRETEEEKKKRVEAKKRRKEEEQEARNKLVVQRAGEAEAVAFLQEIAKVEAVAEMDSAAKRAREEEWERRRVIARDGSEKPQGFEWKPQGVEGDDNEQQQMQMQTANRMDKLIPVGDYYAQHIFPSDALTTFATFNGRVPFVQCEIGFVIRGAWWRNKRFTDAEELRRFLSSPTVSIERIDLGPVHPPNEAKVKESHSRLALRRYLVFDVDLEDRSPETPRGYARGCKCKGTKSICTHGCWFFMRVAIKVLTYLLRQMLGAKHILPVYSGRRGVHVWTLDETFLDLTQLDREGIVKRITQYGNPDKYEHNEHTPYILEFILKPVFIERFIDGPALIRDQGTIIYLMETAREYIDERQCQQLVPYFGRLTQERTLPIERSDAWELLCMAVDEMAMRDAGTFERRAIFTLLFPRLDEDVTSRMGHCIKAPFVIHPVTKRCSVPIPDVDTWTPDMAPRISDLVPVPVNDKNKSRFQNGDGDDREDWLAKKEAAKRAMILDPFVRHVETMVRRAFPYKSNTGSYPANLATAKFY